MISKGEITGKRPNGAKYVTIRPSDFVNPPYIQCPKCGQNTFGVTCIAANQYSRRCRNCLYPTRQDRHAPTRLPELDKKVIYLDQFVISNMMFSLNPVVAQYGKSPNDEFFREVFARLDRLGKKQLLVCPSSEYHTSESLTSPCFEALKQMYELLSYSVRWHHSESVWTTQIIEAFRAWDGGSPPQNSKFQKDDFLYGERTGWTNHFYASSPIRWGADLVEAIRQTRDAVAEGMRTVFEQWQADQDKTFDDWVREETRGAANRYACGPLQQAQEMVAAEAQIINTQQPSLTAAAAFLPTHETGVMMRFRDTLMKKGLAEEEWYLKACEFLQSEHFASVPFLKTGTLIWATVAYRAAHVGQKKLPTRGFSNDVSLISTFLPYCDAMFLDKESHGILSDRLMRDVLDEYGTRIFSLRNKNDFLAYLDGIEGNASQEHTKLLDEVYGERYLTPYMSLYESDSISESESGPEEAGETI